MKFIFFILIRFPELTETLYLIPWRGWARELHQSLRKGQKHTSPSDLTLKSH